MENPNPILLESESESRPNSELEAQPENQPETQPDIRREFFPEYQPTPETVPGGNANQRIRHAYGRVKAGFTQAKDVYQRTPLLKNVTYQGKFLPAFWTIASIFSLFVNIILIAVLVALGHHFFELKALVSDGLVSGLSENLALMDKAHIVTTIPVETTVKVQDDIPVAFDVPINENTQVVLTDDTAIEGTTYINLAPVPLSITLPAGTPITVDFDMTIPVSHTVPVNLTVPVSLLVPIDVPIDQTDLHQSIVGLKETIDPYKGLMESTFNSSNEISFCNQWWSGWLCTIFFGRP